MRNLQVTPQVFKLDALLSHTGLMRSNSDIKLQGIKEQKDFRVY